MSITVELERFEEEYYARFIRIKDGDKTALVFYHDESDIEWALRLAGLDQGHPLTQPKSHD